MNKGRESKIDFPTGLLVLTLALATRGALASEPVVLGGNQGIPPAHPTCPSGDLDGDLVCNPVDNCIGAFNPTQTDLDGDGRGDACDPCPRSGWGRQWFGGQDPETCETSFTSPLAPVGSSSGAKTFGPKS
jgi:hypothetical protein